MRLEYLGGRTNALVQTAIRLVLAIGLIIAGIVMGIIQKSSSFFIIFGVIGLIALLNTWWWYRRAQRLA